MDIILENFRSFKKRVQIPLKPLTFLVGENSSGKSSFLAATSILLDESFQSYDPNFNNPPYSLGSFDTIINNGSKAENDHFVFGVADRGSSEIISYGKDQAKILVNNIDLIINGKTSISIHIRNINDNRVADFQTKIDGKITQTNSYLLLPRERLSAILCRLIKDVFEKNRIDNRTRFRGTYSFAPIRSKPRRTYDEASPPPDPEGGHIPWVLTRYLGHEGRSLIDNPVIEALESFGQESGLFKKIQVKKLGRSSSEPFQIQVKNSGKAVNLLDVGYGVSQALPIIVESLLKSPRTALLLQQPEVHLHPKAQAALGTFFARLVNGTDRLVLIETHSDYMLNRVRREVANGTIEPEKVQILYFSKTKGQTDVYPIRIDANGNVMDAPKHYRDFFIQETFSVFNRGRR